MIQPIAYAPDDLEVPLFWEPVDDGPMEFRAKPITLPRGTPCKLRPSGLIWEVIGGRWDGIRFSANP